jgi:hypothetical protein
MQQLRVRSTAELVSFAIERRIVAPRPALDAMSHDSRHGGSAGWIR